MKKSLNAAQSSSSSEKSVANTETKVVPIEANDAIRIMGVLLVINAVVSFRSIPRIMGTFSLSLGIYWNWIPHFTSTINWTLRVGLALLQSVKNISEPWIAIVDTSIDVSTKKLLGLIPVHPMVK